MLHSIVFCRVGQSLKKYGIAMSAIPIAISSRVLDTK
jgi:hypothetical protein